MRDTGTATVSTLLYNYEQYGDEVVIHNGKIELIKAGKKKGTVRPDMEEPCRQEA